MLEPLKDTVLINIKTCLRKIEKPKKLPQSFLCTSSSLIKKNEVLTSVCKSMKKKILRLHEEPSHSLKSQMQSTVPRAVKMVFIVEK